jgi:hypothetical protein
LPYFIVPCLGDGVEQDFHLAKRFFDQAADFDPDARLPRSFALFLLSSHRDLLVWLGQENVNSLFDAVYPIALRINEIIEQYFSMIAKLARRWLHSQQSSLLSMRRGVTKPSFFLVQLMQSIIRVSMNLMDTVLEACRLFIVYSIVMIWRLTAPITGQPLISVEDVFVALDQGVDVVSELENYLLITCALVLLFLVRIYRMRRRQRALRNLNLR